MKIKKLIVSFYLIAALGTLLPLAIASKTHQIIIQISPPRCLSTAALRMWQARGDFIVMNEPFVSAFALQNKPTENATSNWWQADWWRADAPQTFEEAAQKILQLAESGPVFIKEESYALVDYLRSSPAFMMNPNVHFIFLVRNPHHALVSYYKGHKKIIDRFSYLAGFQPSYEIFKMVQDYGINKPIILCAEDLYNQPYKTAQDLCKSLSITFLEHMLHWQDLGDSFTGATEWHEIKNPELTHYWHGDAINSTGFYKPVSYEVDANGQPTFAEVANIEDRKACYQAYLENKMYYDLLLEQK